MISRATFPQKGDSINVVNVSHLVKNYGLLRAVRDISFTVGQGEIFGILGPNGAGKTTTLECLEGLLQATSGDVEVLGFNPRKNPLEVKERVGIQLQASAYFDDLSLIEILELFAKFYSRKLAPLDLLTRVGLEKYGRTTVAKLSGGQQQRFTIAATLVNDPEVVFLDEPTTGLDPQIRRSIWKLICDLSSEKRTVILSTHYMEEAEVLCHRVAIMDEGLIVALDTPRNLIENLPSPYEIRVTFGSKLDLIQLANLESVSHLDQNNFPMVRLYTSNPTKAMPAIFSLANDQRVEVLNLEVRSGNLEDVFLSKTGRHLVEMETPKD